MLEIEETTKLKLILATIAVLVTMIAPAVLPHVSAQSASFSFNLITPNISKALATITVQGVTILKGSTTRLTGSGTFDTSIKRRKRRRLSYRLQPHRIRRRKRNMDGNRPC
jgi:hypothetical protein